MATVRVPLIGSPTNRASSILFDQRFVNCFPEIVTNPITQERRVFLTKRDGIQYNTNPPGTTGVGRGIASWNSKLYTVIGNKLYSGITAIQTLTTSTGAVGFAEFTAANDYLVLLDGTKGYYISTTDVVTEITDAQFPTSHLPYPVFLDGYLFVQKTTGEIFNCDSGDIVNWQSTSYLSPESYPDGAVAIARQNNLLVALGVNSIEFFYDAANATPGSPLSVNDQAIIQYGCASGTSIAQEEGLLVFVAISATGEKFVTAIKGTKDQVISTEAINRVLVGEGSNISDSWGFLTRQKGHLLYVLNLPSQSRTIVFDFTTEMWHEWEWYDGTTDGVFPMADSCEHQDQAYFLHQANGKTYKASPTVYQDDSRVVKILVQTSRYDGETAKIKFLDRMEVISDWTSGASSMSVYWSDDDYKTWTSARTVDLIERPYLTRCGSFRRRAFKLYHAANTNLRLQALEFEIRLGVH